MREKLKQKVLHETQVESLLFKNRQVGDEIEMLRMQIAVRQQQIKNVNCRYERQYLEKQGLMRRVQELAARSGVHSEIREGLNHQKYEVEIKKYNEKIGKYAERLKQLQMENDHHE